jgi:hypothetical protein
MKLMLGGTILIIAVLQVADWLQENPALGYPTFIVLLTTWIYEIIKDTKKAGR